MANDGLHLRRGAAPSLESSNGSAHPATSSPSIDVAALEARYWSTMATYHSPPPPPLWQRLLLLVAFFALCYYALKGRAQVWRWKEDRMTELGLNLGVWGDWAEDDVI